MTMALNTLLAGTDLVEACAAQAGNVTGITCNSRQVRAGFLFVAIPGTATDGWLYVEEAVSRGAIAVVSEHAPPRQDGACYVQVEDARRALGELAAAFYGNPGSALKTFAITGTNGKTTTAYLTRKILEDAGMRSGLIGTVEYAVGQRSIPASRTTPDAVTMQSLLSQMVSAGCSTAVVEVSSHAIAQRRIAGINFDVAAFTNLTRDHLDYHKTMDAYFEAKAELFDGLRGDAWALVNGDDEWGRTLLAQERLSCNAMCCGLCRDADIRAEHVRLGRNGSSFRLQTPWGNADVHLQLMGAFNISNAILAAGCGCSQKIPVEAIAESLSSVASVRGRLEEIETTTGFHVFVDYAHTDDALSNVCQSLREITRNRLIVVFGCGGDRDRSKRKPMGLVVASLADYAIITSDNPRTESPAQILADIEEGFSDGQPYRVVEDRAEAIRQAVSMADEGDVVLVAGKGHEGYQEFEHRTIPFDDCRVVRSSLQLLAERGDDACRV